MFPPLPSFRKTFVSASLCFGTLPLFEDCSVSIPLLVSDTVPPPTLPFVLVVAISLRVVVVALCSFAE